MQCPKNDSEFPVLGSPESPGLNPTVHLWNVVEHEICIMDVELTDMQQLCEAFRSI